MITGEHCIIRSAEPEDARPLMGLYHPAYPPRAALLDRKREWIVPTTDELREMLAQKDNRQGALLAVEDCQGLVRGFASIRGAHPETRYAELVLLFSDLNDYHTPMADEVFDVLAFRAFSQLHMNKLSAQRVEWETDLHALLLKHGFVTNGVQRDALFTRGRWMSLESLSLFLSDWQPSDAAARGAALAGADLLRA